MFVSLIQLFSKLPDLFLELLDGLQSRVIIDNRPIGYKRCLSGIGKRAEVLLEKGIIGVDAGDHQTVAIPTDRLFKNRG